MQPNIWDALPEIDVTELDGSFRARAGIYHQAGEAAALCLRDCDAIAIWPIYPRCPTGSGASACST